MTNISVRSTAAVQICKCVVLNARPTAHGLTLNYTWYQVWDFSSCCCAAARLDWAVDQVRGTWLGATFRAIFIGGIFPRIFHVFSMCEKLCPVYIARWRRCSVTILWILTERGLNIWNAYEHSHIWGGKKHPRKSGEEFAFARITNLENLEI